jgi:5'(3')-deoxyribonucleotidase
MNNKKPNAFFDLDGMKFDTVGAHMEYINQRYGINSIITDYLDNPSLEKVVKKYRPDFAGTRDEVYRDIQKNLLYVIDAHKEIKPFPGMVEVITEVTKKYNLFTVTARPRQGIQVIEYLLETHIPGAIGHVHCVWNHTTDGVIESPKHEFIKSVKGDNVAFFDDAPNEIRKMEGIIKSYLFDPQRHYDGQHKDLAFRAYSWYEIGDILL